MVTKPMTREHLQEFVECYCSGHIGDRKQTYSEDNPNGRWRCFSEKEIKGRDDLYFKWIDFSEEDERTITEVIEDMQYESDLIAEAVGQIKALLGGIE
jgi:type I restriction enzyme M protein